MILPYTFLNHTTKNRLPNLKSRIWEPVLRYLCLFLYRKINRIYLSAYIFQRLETEINNLLNVIVVLLFCRSNGRDSPPGGSCYRRDSAPDSYRSVWHTGGLAKSSSLQLSTLRYRRVGGILVRTSVPFKTSLGHPWPFAVPHQLQVTGIRILLIQIGQKFHHSAGLLIIHHLVHGFPVNFICKCVEPSGTSLRISSVCSEMASSFQFMHPQDIIMKIDYAAG